MNACCVLQTVILLSCIQEAWNKGAKVKPRGRMIKGGPRGQSGIQGGGHAGGGIGGGDAMGSMYGLYLNRNMSNEERLLQYLFSNYDPVARAVMDTSKPVVVGIDFVLLRIHGLDERSQVLTTTGLVIAEWMDDRLRWDPKMFGNLTDIILTADKIWKPELAVMNGVEDLLPDFERIRVLLNSDGTLHWEPGGIFRTTCDIDIAYFPMDSQHCSLVIGAYSYYSSKMNITNTSSSISTHDFRRNGEWEVYGTSSEWAITVLDCCPGKGYPHVIFTLHLKRRNKFYMMNIVLPCIMLSVLIMIGFYLPPDAGEKISLGISVLLAFTVFLLMIADNIPRTSLAIPLMVIYLTATMILGTISICLTVLVLNVHHRGQNQKVPRWMKKMVLVYLARLVCLKTRSRKKHMVIDKIYVKKHEKIKKGKREGNGVLDELELLSLTVNSRPANGPRMLPPLSSDTANSANHNNLQDLQDLQDDEDTTPENCKDWHEMAHVLDRLFFWILLIAMTVSGLLILLYPLYTGVLEE